MQTARKEQDQHPSAAAVSIVYHGSAQDFDRFEARHFGRNPTMATNGALGIWVTPDRELAERFVGSDGFVYTISEPPGPSRMMVVENLMRLHSLVNEIEQTHGRDAACTHYEGIRSKLRSEGYDSLWILEKDGSSPTRVLLDPEAIIILEKTRMGVAAEVSQEIEDEMAMEI